MQLLEGGLEDDQHAVGCLGKAPHVVEGLGEDQHALGGLGEVQHAAGGLGEVCWQILLANSPCEVTGSAGD